eukprot:3095346-Alexandrium_andersonii.AAC.1
MPGSPRIRAGRNAQLATCTRSAGRNARLAKDPSITVPALVLPVAMPGSPSALVPVAMSSSP